MIEFLLHQDIKDSVLIDQDDLSLIDRGNEKKFIDVANEWYLNEAQELGVSESEIIVYDPNIDTSDLRDYWCKRLCEYHFLKDVFFALWKKGDKSKDVYHEKYTEATKLFNNMQSKLTPNRIRGNKPAERKTTNSYSTTTRHLGDASRSTCNNQQFDCECY